MTSATATRLRELGIVLPEPSSPKGSYTTARHGAGLVHCSGHGPLVDGKPTITGRVPDPVDIEQARDAARLTAINLLATLAAAADGDLDRVEVLSVTGYVNAADSFRDHAQVVDAASELLVQVLGGRGMHARTACGASSLPFGIPVEISLVATLGR